MAKEAGVVKFISGKAVAIDQNGNERELKVGDILYMGESIKTSDAADKITIVSNNGKEITIVGNDTLALNQSTIGAEGLADVSDLQNAILNGGDLTKLEETAAGGNTAAGGGDGVSLSDAKFAEGGHYSNINATYRNLSDTNRAFASYDSPISGYNGGDDTIIPSNPLVTFISDLNNDGTLSRVEHARDTNLNTSKVLITIPNDGTVRAGDILNITITKPDGNTENKTIPITPTIISNGYQFDAPIQTGKISKVDATITNFQGNVSGRSEDSVTSSGFSAPEVKFTEDNSPDNNLLTYTENAKDGKLNETPVLITVKDVIVGDVLHVTLTKPNGTTEVRNVSIDQNIIDNGYKISNMPVEHGKPSKVEAYVADSTNTMRSATASDSTTLDVKPTLTFTEDQDNNGYLYDPENSQDNNFRSTTVEITLPKDVVVGDKIVITYTDPLHISQNLEKSITLTQEMIDNQKVNTSLPIFPDVRTSASVHVVDKNNVRKSEESDQDSVMPIGRNLEMTLPEEKTLHEISRQESMDEHEVNETTALIRLPNKIDNGDIVTLTINEPTNGVYTRNFTINMNNKGEVTSITEIGNGGQDFPLTKESYNQYSFKVPGFDLRNGQDTTIRASITNMTPDRHTSINEPEVSASLEHVKKPEVIFKEADGAKTMSREQAMSDDNLNSTTVTIKLPKNAVSGDKLTVTIENELDEKDSNGKSKFHKEDPKEYTVRKDPNGKFYVEDSGGNKIDTDTDGRSFKISGIKTATGLETKVTAEIKDKDGIQHAEDTSTVTISNINDMAVYFKEDADRNVSLTRAESKDADGDLHKTTVVVKVPNNVIAGDVVTVKMDNDTSPKTYKVTGRDPSGKIMLEDTSTHTSITASDKNEIEIPGVEIIAGKTINVTTETTDASGGKKAEAQNHNTLEKLHEDMEITFEKDTNNDGILGSTEATGATTIATIKLPSNFVLGDKLIVESHNEDTPNNKTTKIYEIVKDNNGKLIAKNGSEELDITDDADRNKVVKYTLGLTEDHKTIINAKVTDNTGADKVETNSDITLDAQGSGSGTGFRLFIDEDKDRNGVLSRDEAMKDGKLNTTSATLQIPTTVNSGDIIKVKVNGGVEQEYTVVSNVSNRITLKFPDNHTELLPTDNKLKISNVHIDKDNPAVVKATIKDINTGSEVVKTAKATLQAIDTKGIKVEFVEDNASRDNVIDRDEAILDNDIKKTIISVQVPHNVTNGDKVAVTIKEPQANGTTGSRTITYTVSKTANGKISLTDDSDTTHTPHELENNTIKIPGVAMLPGRETSAVATITNGAETTTSSEAKAKLAPLSEAGLSVSIVADKNDNGIISRDESGSKISKVHVSIPGSVIAGDKIDVKITNPNGSTLTKHYEVMRKDVNGKITLKNLDDSSQQTLDRDKPLDLNATIAVDKETKAEVTLTDTFGESKTVSDTAHAEIDAIRGIMFNKDIKTSESGERSTTVKVYLNEDARNGDTVEFKYTDPDNHHALTKTATHTLSAEDITKGVFEQSLDINARSAYDLEVKATLKTSDSDGLESKSYEPYKPLHIGVENYTVKFDASKDMKGGKGNDTLVFDGDKVNFNNISNLDSKVESFENLELKGKTEIKFNVQNILDITDNPDTVLKIKGGDVDANGNKITKVDLDHKWDRDSNYDASGFKGYSSIDQINGKTIHIQIDDKIHTDL
ncbi:retention module-containing protein [Campylobacter concisus]|uniref:retention module-containing protein n=1 Tax=Campylobacter concisus TaxID=199 RepID=UPI0018839DC5|nr:retention module-containing protein [Campylobacter concisus]MBE9818545.1 retention module-containing protein [Campylobacter concisus]